MHRMNLTAKLIVGCSIVYDTATDIEFRIFIRSEIAERLQMSQYTVRDYIQTVMEKTGFHSRTELAVKARESGIVILDRKN